MRWIVLSLGLGAVGVGALAQQAPVATSTSLSPAVKDLAAASLEAAAFPKGDPRAVQLNWEHAASSGEPARACVETGEGGAVRSGDFIVGPFGPFRTNWQQGRTKLWWAPQFLTNQRPHRVDNGLLLRATQLDGSGHHTQTFDSIVTGPNYGGFFNTTAWLPNAGRWMIIATFESNWGCFIVDAK